jgi:hypothetical protein
MLFTERNSRRIEELDDVGWIYDVPFLLGVSDHWNALNIAQ